MSIEDQIRAQLREYAQTMESPRELDARIRESYQLQFKLKENGKTMKKKWITAMLVIGVLLAPTSAFAYNLLTDNIYGSFDQLKKKIVTVTKEQYMALGMKLSGAQKTLGNEEYAKFEQLLKKITAAKVEYGDANGNINYELLPADKLAEQKKVLSDIQPYFDKLNHQKSSRDTLTPDEYDRYIDAIMTYETVLVKAGVDPSKGPVASDKLPAELRANFEQAQQVINEVDKKIRP